VIQTKGLGSCVALMLYDRGKRVGGLAHISLPVKTDEEPEENLHKYAGFAIDALLRIMERTGVLKGSVVAKIVGGGNMFGFDLDLVDDVGRQNVTAIRDALGQNQIPIIREHVFGTAGRNVVFDLSSGSVRVSGPDKKEIIL